MRKQGIILILASAFILLIGAVWLHQSPSPLQTNVSMTPDNVATDRDRKEVSSLLGNRMDSIDKQVNNIQVLYLDLSKRQNEVVDKIDKLSSMLQELHDNQSKKSPTPLTNNKEIKSEEFLNGKFRY